MAKSKYSVKKSRSSTWVIFTISSSGGRVLNGIAILSSRVGRPLRQRLTVHQFKGKTSFLKKSLHCWPSETIGEKDRANHEAASPHPALKMQINEAILKVIPEINPLRPP
ncbi:MAG: hypothetical protein ACHQLQ_05985 [Candidatus Acidiferrales bacterium]